MHMQTWQDMIHVSTMKTNDDTSIFLHSDMYIVSTYA